MQSDWLIFACSTTNSVYMQVPAVQDYMICQNELLTRFVSGDPYLHMCKATSLTKDFGTEHLCARSVSLSINGVKRYGYRISSILVMLSYSTAKPIKMQNSVC